MHIVTRGRFYYFSLAFSTRGFFLRFYLFINEEKKRERERERERERAKQRQAEGEEAPCKEPDLGLDPGSPGSGPGLKAALNH